MNEQDRIQKHVEILFSTPNPPAWVYYPTPKGWMQQFRGHAPESFPNAAFNVVYNHALKTGILASRDYPDHGQNRWHREYIGGGSVEVAGHTFHVECVPAGRDDAGRVVSSGNILIRPDPGPVLDRYVISVYQVFSGGYVYRFDPIRHI